MTITRRACPARAPAAARPPPGPPPWPSRPVRLISPFAPGGPQDVRARYVLEHPTSRLGQPVNHGEPRRRGRNPPSPGMSPARHPAVTAAS
jgi:tripartite-type tricarboxylate transporter receptor subunit TctC